MSSTSQVFYKPFLKTALTLHSSFCRDERHSKKQDFNCQNQSSAQIISDSEKELHYRHMLKETDMCYLLSPGSKKAGILLLWNQSPKQPNLCTISPGVYTLISTHLDFIWPASLARNVFDCTLYHSKPGEYRKGLSLLFSKLLLRFVFFQVHKWIADLHLTHSIQQV